jgi:hypothetical protein
MRDRPGALAGRRGALGCAHNGGGDYTVALAGVWCSGLGSGLCAKVASAKGTRWGVDAQRGLGPCWSAVQGSRRRGPAAETGWRSRRGLMQYASELLIPMGRFSAELGSQRSDQHGRRNAGGEELWRRTDSPAVRFS